MSDEKQAMATLQNPVVGRRKLRTALRRAREATGRTQEQVADAMEWSLSKVIRIESGSVGISANDMKALLHLYRIVDPDRVDNLVDLARASRQRPWWTAHRELLNEVYVHFLGLETGATRIQMFQMAAVPGLFQTEAYARTTSNDFWVGNQPSPAETDERVTVRLTRQREILDRPDPAELSAIIDEAVLHHVVGDRAAMRQQLARLEELGRRPNISIQVLPFTAGVSPYLSSFVILGFPDAEDTDVVYLEHALAQVVIEDARQMDSYQLAFKRLRDRALPADESVELIRRVADGFR